MMQSYLPNKQIGLAIGRTLLTGQSRWAYVAIVCVNAIIIAGGGFALGGGLQSFLEAASGLLVVNLQFLWIWLAVRLLALNDPTAARMVPHYVWRLRVTALWIWVSIVATTGLVGGVIEGGILWATVGSAVLTVFLATPFRWPVRWCIAVFLLVQLASRVLPNITKEVLAALMPWFPLMASVVIGSCAVITMFYFHRNGSTHGKFFSSQLGGALPKGLNTAVPKLAELGVWGSRLMKLGQWLTYPFAIFARKSLGRKTPGNWHFWARVELGFGPSAHWTTQVQMLLALLFGIAMLSIFDVRLFSGFIAGGLLAIAALPLLSLPELLRKSIDEQKLMLMLPSMPQGNALTRQLVTRQLVQGYVSWGVAAAIAACLPLEGAKLAIAISGYLAVLILIPWLPTIDWAKLKPLSAERGLLGLALLAAVGIGFFALQHWKLMQVAMLFTTALAISLASLKWRWSQVKRYPQAFPAGHLKTLADLA